MALKAVLDTNIVLYFLGGRLASSLPDRQYQVSVITEMELLSYPALNADDLNQIQQFLRRVEIVELTPPVRQAAIQVRRETRLRLPDAVVAATALLAGVELFSNDAVFSRVPDLTVSTMPLR